MSSRQRLGIGGPGRPELTDDHRPQVSAAALVGGRGCPPDGLGAVVPQPAFWGNGVEIVPPFPGGRARMCVVVPFAPYPVPPCDPAIEQVAATLNPVLTPLGFAPGQPGASGGHGQVIFCRGHLDGSDGGCVDLVVDLEATPEWRITDVRYWGSSSERGHLTFDRDGDLVTQLSGLTRTLLDELS